VVVALARLLDTTERSWVAAFRPVRATLNDIRGAP
jgi:hypothetical protein